MQNFIQRNYFETKAKYEKYSRRLNRKIANGTFYTLNQLKQKQIINRVKALFKKLKSLELALKMGIAGVTMTFALSIGNVTGQEIPFKVRSKIFKKHEHRQRTFQKINNHSKSDLFVLVQGKNNPFDGSNPFNNNETLEGWADFVDIDNDGDLDVILTTDSYDPNTNSWDDRIIFYKNVGTVEIGILEKYTADDNPFNNILINNDKALRFIDIDNDTDLDLFLLDETDDDYYSSGRIRYFKNIGTVNNPAFEEQIESDNPFDSARFNAPGGFNFVDIDNDGDLDMFIGDLVLGDCFWEFNIRFFKNTGFITEPAFEEFFENENPLNGVSNYFYDIPAFADMDGDGDYDAIIGSYYYSPIYFKNEGFADNPLFIQQYGSNNPFDNISLGYYSQFNPKFIDYDMDGDLDILILDGEGLIYYFKNTGTIHDPVMTDENGLNTGYLAFPEFVDLDKDGDLDLVVGTLNYYYGYTDASVIKYFKNTGTNLLAKYEEQYGENNPFSNLETGSISFPKLIDIDFDGDLDLFNNELGEEYFEIIYYKNIGTVEQAVFEEQPYISNPLNVLENEYMSFISFTDIDFDGDYDCFVGSYIEINNEYYSVVKYYKNVGSKFNPQFVYENSPITINSESTYILFPDFADIDNDGDYDCIIGSYDEYTEQGVLLYIKNEGTIYQPLFRELTGTENPFSNLLFSDYLVFPTFADLDYDGDSDLLIGTLKGTILYYKNTIINTNVNDIEVNSNIDIYPNPTKGIVGIDLDNNTNLEVNIELYDYLGKKVDVFNFESNKIELDITHLPSGMYFVKIRQGESIISSKIIKR